MLSSFLPRQLKRWLLIAVMLTGCEKPTVDVNIHGVNYKGDAFSYVVAEPARPDSAAGGELVDAFAAGGTTRAKEKMKHWVPLPARSANGASSGRWSRRSITYIGIC